MAKRSLTLSERETVILTDDTLTHWRVYTCSPSMKRRLQKYRGKAGVLYRKIDSEGVEYEIPLTCLRFVLPATDEARERMKEQGRAQAGNLRRKGVETPV